MKKIILAIVIIIVSAFFVDTKASSSISRPSFTASVLFDTLPSNDPVLQYFNTVNLAGYLNGRIDTFLNTIARTPDNLSVSSCGSTKEGLFNACYLQVEFGTGLVKDFTIRFFVREFMYMNRYSATRSWNPLLMKKEKFYRIEIYYLWDKIKEGSLL